MNATRIFTILLALMMAASAVIITTSDSSEAAKQILEDGDDFTCYTFSPTFSVTSDNTDFWRWDFGDGTILDSRDMNSDDSQVRDAYIFALADHGGDISNPRHTYAATGTYTLVVTGFNSAEDGTEQSTTKTVNVIVEGHPTVTFMVNGEEYASVQVPKGTEADIYEPVSISASSTATMPEDPQGSAANEFRGWYLADGTEFTEDTAVAEHITVTARFGTAGVTHSVTFNGASIAAQTVDDGDTATMPEDPTLEGYKFAGWYADADFVTEFDWTAPITEDTVVYVKWTEVSVDPDPDLEPDPGTDSDPEPTPEPTPDDSGDITMVASMIVAVLGLLIAYVGLRSGSGVIALIGIIILAIGGLSAYAESIGSDLMSWINGLLGGSK